MTQTKSTRAFRTISEAGEELELQPHVLRFWESKFPQIQPMKRSGGRRFYRPEDIEFLRGIKILLHREKHPIKDVQKLIRIRGHQSVVELGRSVERASRPKDIKETNLVPKRIKPVVKVAKPEPAPAPEPEPPAEKPKPADDGIIRRIVPFGKSSRDPESAESAKVDPVMQEPITRILDVDEFKDDDDDMSIPAFDEARREPAKPEPIVEPEPVVAAEVEETVDTVDRENLETALSKLKSLKTRWEKYQT
ncbi:MAG: MerR family transcriptional regulator [Hyphomonadaceae bacterium]|nr:MerR family transcriptional regulator [Hyphomonadaceae bacterium]